MDVFEVPKEESQDIDDFIGLQSAAVALSEAACWNLRKQGNNKRGIGHIYRALEMADEFYRSQILFMISTRLIPLRLVIPRTLIPVNGIIELFQRCKGWKI